MKPRSPAPAIGVIGVGSLGYHHARILSGLADTEMVGLFDVNAERAEHVGRDLAVTAHGSLEALLDQADAVVVAVVVVLVVCVAGVVAYLTSPAHRLQVA